MVKRALTLLTSIIIALPLLMPFNIYGAGETQIVPTYTSSTTQQEWQTKIRITNYCEGNNASTASCKLSFYVMGPYYGIINIDGYDSSGTHWINGGYIFVSDGYGEYNYNFYQNGIKQISSVSIWGVQLFQPDSNVDLTQIISLLTSINNYEQQNNILIDEIVDNTDTIESNQLDNIQQIKNVISQLIVSNGYLETLTKLRQWNTPFESLNFVIPIMKSFEVFDVIPVNYFKYPIISVNSGSLLYRMYTLYNKTYDVIFIVNKNIQFQTLSNYLSIKDQNGNNISLIDSGSYYYGTYIFDNSSHYLIHFKFNTSNIISRVDFNTLTDIKIIPIYFNRNDIEVSTDFALLYGLSNRLLDDLNLIANGTTASQSAAQSSDSANSQLQTESNTLFQQENGFKSDMQNAMQNVNNTFRLQDMGTKFVSSAQWVRSQYENLTNNTPFASLITFSLITGLALILLGKVYK